VLAPVRVELRRSDGELVHAQELRFVNPLHWAFLGPFEDPGGRGLDAPLAPDHRVGGFSGLPRFEGVEWKVVSDGSCYDEFGLVDLNKVFDIPNGRWKKGAPSGTPQVAYAVTCVLTGHSHHTPVAFAADDAAKVWVDGRLVLRVGGNSPIETGRQIIGVRFEGGRPVPGRGSPAFPIEFKVAQKAYYWQLLFEPDDSFPYGRSMGLFRLPHEQWPE
jgi:hypothetical protein